MAYRTEFILCSFFKPVDAQFNVTGRYSTGYNSATIWDEGPDELSVNYSRYESVNDVGRDQIIEQIFSKITDLDVVTTFRILSARRRCVEVQPDFAKDAVRRQFPLDIKGIMTDLLPERATDSLNAEELYDLLALYTFLIGTARLMNLLVQEPLASISVEFEPPEDYPPNKENRTWGFYRDLRPIWTDENMQSVNAIRKQIPSLTARISRQIDALIE